MGRDGTFCECAARCTLVRMTVGQTLLCIMRKDRSLWSGGVETAEIYRATQAQQRRRGGKGLSSLDVQIYGVEIFLMRHNRSFQLVPLEFLCRFHGSPSRFVPQSSECIEIVPTCRKTHPCRCRLLIALIAASDPGDEDGTDSEENSRQAQLLPHIALSQPGAGAPEPPEMVRKALRGT